MCGINKEEHNTEWTAAAPMPEPLCEVDKDPCLCSTLHAAKMNTQGHQLFNNYTWHVHKTESWCYEALHE